MIPSLDVWKDVEFIVKFDTKEVEMQGEKEGYKRVFLECETNVGFEKLRDKGAGESFSTENLSHLNGNKRWLEF